MGMVHEILKESMFLKRSRWQEDLYERWILFGFGFLFLFLFSDWFSAMTVPFASPELSV